MSQASATSGLVAFTSIFFVLALGSLFFSEIMELPPCSLCWVQRIFMFPLAIILLIGLFPFDPQAAVVCARGDQQGATAVFGSIAAN